MLSIPGYLERTSLLNLWFFRIRLHRILDIDRTPYLHTHPFSYLSIVLSGGYTEQFLVKEQLTERKHKAGAMILRSRSTPHRISAVEPGTRTLFFALYRGGWELFEHPDVKAEGYFDPPDGVYLDLNSKGTFWRKRDNSRWYTLERSRKAAVLSTKLSIFQNINPDELLYLHALDHSRKPVQRT